MHHQTLYGILYILIAWGCISCCRAVAVSHRFSQITHIYTEPCYILSPKHATGDTHKHTQHTVCLLVLSLRAAVHRAEIRMEGPVVESLPGPVAMTLLLPFLDTHSHSHTYTQSLSPIPRDIKMAEWLPPSLEISEPSPSQTINARTPTERKITQ